MNTALLIDRDADFRALFAGHLGNQGWRVFEADNGETGLELVFEHRPDFVLCDLLIPRVNGFQICRSIRAQANELGHTKVIVTTGSGYDTDRMSAIEAGADEYLVKPFTPADLSRTLESMLGTVSSGRHEPAQAAAFGSPKIKFWGVRGSIPTPGPATVHYGGNTSCVEVRADGEIIILDAGTGIRALGQGLATEFKDQPLNLTLLISHTHWDHIQGFPFFEPAYNPRNRVRILGYDGARTGLESTLSGQMESPYFPISLKQMPGHVSIHEIKELQFAIGSVQVQAAFLNHPGICVGYRLLTSAGSIAYLPDNEPFQRLKSQPEGQRDKDFSQMLQFAMNQDQKLIEFIKEADVLIIDAQYNDEEYQTHYGWGHGCVDDVVALALIAKVKNLFLFHHDPDHDDAQIHHMVDWARGLVASQNESLIVEGAREGTTFVLEPRQ